ncbi:esterase/lipase family protein [Dactylosporangium sp. NPDC048998]|uniref:esterase/lipase family protein n=1 Tax=Dactylosporangium sp. NPDC048998 TaxID=3363976 RepID=UPI00371208DB
MTASSLLRFPAFARVLQGIEPYTHLVAAARAAVYNDAQVVQFPYDWRLPVAHNAALLADRAAGALEEWRRNPDHDYLRRRHPTGRPAQLVIVAHSMGGLLARYLSRIPGVIEHVRATVTLGTPFYGSAKAAVLLNTGRGAPLPLPARRPVRHLFEADVDDGVRRLAASLPGLHDLLPSYRCVNNGPPGRRLTEGDAVTLGGDPDLVANSWQLHRDLDTATLAGHRCMVGTFQPTAQSLTITDGIVTLHRGVWTDGTDAARWIDDGGDGTVFRGSATLPGTGIAHTYLPQQHGALARTDEACTFARAVITEQDLDRLGPPLAGAGLGLDLPDLATPGEECIATITGITRSRDATAVLIDLSNGQVIDRLAIHRRDGQWCAPIIADRPGLYRVEVAGGGYSAVQQLVLVTDPDLAADNHAA